MPNRRSIGRLEAKKARNYCYENSVRRNVDLFTEVSERVFTGTENDLCGYVLAEVHGETTGEIPLIPQGTVIKDIHNEDLISLEKLCEA